MRFNQGEGLQNSATVLWVHNLTAPGVNAHNWLMQTQPGDSIYIQDKDDASKWQAFKTTGPVVDKTTYVEFPITFSKGGTFLSPQRVMLSITRVGGGTDLSYEGDHVPSSAHQDGDIVIKSNIAYIAVRDTTQDPDPSLWGAVGIPPPTTPPAIPSVVNGQWLKGASGAMVWAPITIADVDQLQTALDQKNITRGLPANLPASPYSGQQYLMVDSLTGPTYQWLFRYDPTVSGTYKWECIGGAPVHIGVAAGGQTTASASFTSLSTSGPNFTIPRAGDWMIEFGTQIYNATANAGGAMGVKVGAASNTDAEAVFGFSNATANTQMQVMRARLLSAVAASTALVSEYHAVGGTAGFQIRWLRVIPVRII